MDNEWNLILLIPPFGGLKVEVIHPVIFSQHEVWAMANGACEVARRAGNLQWLGEIPQFPIFFKGGFPKIAAWSYHGTTLPWLVRLDFSVPFKWCFKRLIWGYLPNINWCRILSIAISTDAGKPQSKQETEGLRIRLPTHLKFNQWIPKKMPSWRPETHVPKAHHFWYHTSGQISGVDK